MAIDNVRLPVEVEQGATGGPRFKTSIQTALSGIEQRIAEWDVARCEYDVGYAARDKALLDAVLQLYRDRQGPAFPFRFKDWNDFEVSNVEIGTGGSGVEVFQLVKRYDLVFEVIRAIQLPVEGTVEISVDGDLAEEETDYTVDYSTGLVTFATAPAADEVITASFEFDVPVRFASDTLAVSMTMVNLGDIPSIPLIEVLGE